MNPNLQQQAVIDHVDGPCLVTAVPGSGKTASVTERTKSLISKGVDPASILAITFTKKAAEEMKVRIGGAVGPAAAGKMTISTFHALCARIIRGNASLLGLTKTYTIYDTDDQERLLKRCIAKIEDAPEVRDGGGFLVKQAAKYVPTDEYLDSLMAYIEGMRNACMTPEDAASRYGLSGNQPAVAKKYFEEIRKADAVDFTGLLSETTRLFDEHPEVLETYRRKFKYISVDEVQDTNVAQYKLIKQLGMGHKNVLCVGDMDQSLYAFRGACVENILDFEKDFGAKVLKLEINYRSTPQILRYSQNLIEHNVFRKGTSLKTENQPGDCPQIVGFTMDDAMATYIAENIRLLINKGTKPSQIAVLYRINSASRLIEQKIRERNIPYKIIGGLDFYSRKEIKACMSVLKLLCNENDKAAFEKVSEYCCRGVGEVAVSAVMDHSASESVSVCQAARQYLKTGTQQAKALAPLVGALDAARVMPADKGLMHVAKTTAFWGKMEQDSTSTNDRLGNIDEMSRDVERHLSLGGTLVGYLQNISLMSAADQNNEDAEVKLMSMHACKGLEFDVVFISHACHGIIPHDRTLAIQDETERATQLEEERRLLYVAMTRAKKTLRICFCRGGMNKVFDPSSFLKETGLIVPVVAAPPAKKAKKAKPNYEE